MARNLNFRSKGTDHARAPQKPKRTAARNRDQWIAERSLAVRSARSQAAKAARTAEVA